MSPFLFCAGMLTGLILCMPCTGRRSTVFIILYRQAQHCVHLYRQAQHCVHNLVQAGVSAVSMSTVICHVQKMLFHPSLS